MVTAGPGPDVQSAQATRIYGDHHGFSIRRFPKQAETEIHQLVFEEVETARQVDNGKQ
jgi:hypothetical protein